MVKNRIEYRFGEFVDFAGRQRKYVVAAVSELINCGCVTTMINDNLIMDEVVKKLSLGFAICNPEDKWDEELGKRIALGKAMKRPARVLYVSHAGMINTNVVNTLINQEMKYVEKAPSTVFKGYETAEKKWIESKKQQMN
jgi:hypothetical protein